MKLRRKVKTDSFGNHVHVLRANLTHGNGKSQLLKLEVISMIHARIQLQGSRLHSICFITVA